MKKSVLVDAMLERDQAESAGVTEEKSTESKTERRMAKPNMVKNTEKRTYEHKVTNAAPKSNQDTEEKHAERENDNTESKLESSEIRQWTSCNGILEVLPDGYGFIRSENYLPRRE